MVQWLTLQLYIWQKPFPILDSELAILADGFVIFLSLLRWKLWYYFKVIHNCFILVSLNISNVNASDKSAKETKIYWLVILILTLHKCMYL
jgi:hypothetical protein